MRFLIETQILAILFAFFWVLYLNIIAFFDQPGRALQYINWFVFGFAILLTIIYFLMTKYFIGRNWMAVLLILLPYFLIYQPFFERLQSSLVNDNYRMMINFLSRSTGTLHVITMLFGIMMGIMFSKPQSKG
ncbi:hypothetical protein BACCIP111895_04507 [Neobacillus rhizosphaerae]|uniref:Uncharacterized protein n=1 Tax=Neobacillus rhizosphaerae TaxID=2880965 RepID=A0ABM9EX91_9BACI|nr:hypothetical protein [Neobacillus rhizosphaerae]CAH2717315.1 hypothetical protein BACCIP111895_04507 [Neobacillus rhizosphaerae]